MTDREKVYAGLAACGKQACGDCPYDLPDARYCKRRKLMDDALALLKEQEKQLKEWEKHVPFLAAHGILKGDEDNA